MARRYLSHFAVFAVTAAAVGTFALSDRTCGCAAPLPAPAAAPAAAPDGAAPDGTAPVAVAIGATFSVLGGDEPSAAPIGAAFRDARTGLVVTNAHVVGDAGTVVLAAADGRRARATVLARDEVKDLAVLSGGFADAPGLAIADAGTPAPGQPVYAIGAPLGLGHSVTRGIVSAVGREIDARSPYPAIQHDAALNPGSSGGPLIGRDGRVVGLNAAMPDGFRRHIGIGYAIPAPVVARFLDDAAAGRPLGTRRVGIRVRAIEGGMAAALGLAPGSGVLVEEVAPGSDGARAGIAAGDVIVEAGGRAVARAHDLTVAIDAVAIDAPVALRLARAGAALTLALPGAVPEAPAAGRPAGAAGGVRDGATAPAALGIGFDEAADAAILLDPPTGSPAAAAGLRAGEAVLAVGTAPVASARDALARIAGRPGPALAVLVRDGGGATRYVVVDPSRGPVDGLGERGNIRSRDSVAF